MRFQQKCWESRPSILQSECPSSHPPPPFSSPNPSLCALTCRIPLPSEFLNLCVRLKPWPTCSKDSRKKCDEHKNWNERDENTLTTTHSESQDGLTSIWQASLNAVNALPPRLVWWVLGCRISGVSKMNLHVCCYVDVTFATLFWKEHNGRPASGGVLAPEQLRATRTSETISKHCIYIQSSGQFLVSFRRLFRLALSFSIPPPTTRKNKYLWKMGVSEECLGRFSYLMPWSIQLFEVDAAIW